MSEMLPTPDETTRPEPGLCAECGAKVQPVWLPITKPHWHVTMLCPNCADRLFQREQGARNRKRYETALRERISRAGLASPYHASRTFETFESLPGTEDAVAAAWRFARDMADASIEVQRGLLFIGVHPEEPNGCGKTHLALAILHYVLNGNLSRSGLFIQFADYLEALKRSFREVSRDDASYAPEGVRWAMFEVDLLVLDDIGSFGASRSGWDAEEMCRLLNHRIETGRPIVATTDVGPDELSERLGKRVVSRIYEACEVVRIAAGDYRRRKR